jgi:hypothetical protein
VTIGILEEGREDPRAVAANIARLNIGLVTAKVAVSLPSSSSASGIGRCYVSVHEYFVFGNIVVCSCNRSLPSVQQARMLSFCHCCTSEVNAILHLELQ